MIRHNCAQNSTEWWKLRKGIPTSSGVKRIITAKKGEYAAGAAAYASELVAASLGWESSFKGNEDTDRGNEQEDEARRWIRLRTKSLVKPVGFFMDDTERYGASPDGELEDGSPVEIKNPDLHTFITWFRMKSLPDDHKAQCHMHMLVTGADRCLFLAYTTCPAVDKILIEVRRDGFTEKLASCLDRFCDELDALRRDVTGDEYENIFPQNGKNPPTA